MLPTQLLQSRNQGEHVQVRPARRAGQGVRHPCLGRVPRPNPRLFHLLRALPGHQGHRRARRALLPVGRILLPRVRQFIVSIGCSYDSSLLNKG